jgi:hypothetical protein
MTVDKRLEALYGKIELVRGVGKPRQSQLCIMSLVAFLAGERHSDHPNTASPTIGRFAITINDQMPDHLRGRLKPFAPAIIGTRDELDRMRAEMLTAAVREEVLPRMRADFVGLSSGDDDLLDLARGLCVSHVLRARLATFLNRPAGNDRVQAPGEIAATTADVLVCCAREAPSAAVSTWYWTKAIDLLDRMCEIRHPHAATIDPARIIRLDELLARHQRARRGGAGAAWAIERVRRLLPDWAIPD